MLLYTLLMVWLVLCEA